KFLERAQEIALADLNAVVAQNVVGGRGVEEEVREGELRQIDAGLEGHLLTTESERDLAVGRTVELLRLQALQEVDRLGEALLQFGERRFRVGEARYVDA